MIELNVIKKTTNKSRGITLIALIITIIILLILAGVTILTITGENGILSRSATAVNETDKQETKETLEFVFQEALIEETQNKEYNSNEFLDEFIKARIPEAEINENIVKIQNYEFTIDRENLKIISIDEAKINNIEENTSLIGAVSKISESGYNEIEVTGKNTDGVEETVKYATHVIINDGDLVLDGTTIVEGATLESNVYEFGDKEVDVATASEDAKNMVILKVNGNLTINEGVTLTACKSDSGYGGPKGLFIYCTGTLTNNGTISMTARGARAEGQNVYLWENKDGSYEYVPAVGAKGAEKQQSSGSIQSGKNGEDGTGRQTGGGGSGAAKRYSASSGTRLSGKGGNGTSYSGGSGGGAVCARDSAEGKDGNENGGAGGKGISNYSANYGAGGGAGNPGGSGMKSSTTYTNVTYAGENGTGGLIILYSNKIINSESGIIESNGSKGGKASSSDNIASGGGSGAGSINIFYIKSIEKNGTISCEGQYINNGGAGGSGTVTIGMIENGNFTRD